MESAIYNWQGPLAMASMQHTNRLKKVSFSEFNLGSAARVYYSSISTNRPVECELCKSQVNWTYNLHGNNYFIK